MEMPNTLPHAVEAIYTPQLIERYRGNPLIEALEPPLADEELAEALTERPAFSEEHRQWPTPDRIFAATGLVNFCVPLVRHIALGRSLDALIHEGYVGRAPRTAEYVSMMQEIYSLRKAKKKFKKANRLLMSRLSAALVGISGMGKTTTAERILGSMQQVIYHRDLNIWQVTYLHVPVPHDGMSVKALLRAILMQIDTLIPDANCYETYGATKRLGVEQLILNVATVLRMFSVGVLIVDDIENLENAPRDRQDLMSFLVSVTNIFKVPVLFIGTNKARRLLGLDWRQARRSVGFGLSYWDRLSRHNEAEMNKTSEWDDLFAVLKSFYWLRNPCEFSESLSDTFYYYSQGVIDIAIKLYIAAQVHAMLDGSEAITSQLVAAIAKTDFAPLQPMLDALRTGDLRALENYDDIAPLDLEDLVSKARRQYEGKRLRSASVRPGDEQFIPTVTSSLTAAGVDADIASTLAEKVAAENESQNVLEGVSKALSELRPPRRTSSSKGNREATGAVLARDVELMPGDLRLAIRRAQENKSPILDALVEMGAVCDLEKTLELT